MYIVIFKATLKKLDDEYQELAKGLRTLAMDKYGCLDFYSATENNQETTLSYWPSLQAIQAWKADPLHQQGQKLGKERWYQSYTVQISEVIKEYNSKTN